MKLHHYISSIIIQASVMLLVLLLASSCGRKEADELFVRVEAVMDEHPDSALAMLDSVAYMTDGYSRSQLMRYHLLHAKAQNKAYVDFTSDSIMKEVVAYYDAHGTANEQVEAHYLLGCVYRDLKESPMALQCYLDATEKADTLSADCDYGMLMRVWGQIANEFDRQAMPYKELEALEEFRKYAKLCDDTLNYIVGIERKMRAFVLIEDTLNALKCINTAYKLYMEIGNKRYAAFSTAPMSKLYLSRGEIDKANRLLCIYECESGRFDSENNIAKGFENYYGTKALYYEKINMVDSAAFYYRKLRSSGYEYEACLGLFGLFSKTCQIDSIIAYAQLYRDALGLTFSSLHTQAMFNAEGMFNYSRNQRIAAEKEKEAELNRQKAFFIAILSFISVGVILYLFFRFKVKKKEELEHLASQYEASTIAYHQAKEDYVLMESDFESYKHKKNKEITELQSQWENAAERYESKRTADSIKILKALPVITDIQQRFEINRPGQQPSISDKEWQDIFDKIKELLPRFYIKVLIDDQFGYIERKVATLSLIGESTSNIAKMLDTSASNVSNTKASINTKLFDDCTAKTLQRNLANIDRP